jgi:hypothetical protein
MSEYFFSISQSLSLFFLQGMWCEGRAGGCMNHSGWSMNPKYHFTVSYPTEVTFILQREEHTTSRKEIERPFIGFYIFRAKRMPLLILLTISHLSCHSTMHSFSFSPSLDIHSHSHIGSFDVPNFERIAEEYGRLSRDNLVLKTKHFLDLKEGRESSSFFPLFFFFLDLMC